MKERIAKILRSIVEGKLLLRLKVDKYFPQILYFFITATFCIGINIGIENTIHKKEKNKVVLENLKSIHTDLKCKKMSLDSVCEVEDMLEDKGSSLRIPTRKAIVLTD